MKNNNNSNQLLSTISIDEHKILKNKTKKLIEHPKEIIEFFYGSILGHAALQNNNISTIVRFKHAYSNFEYLL